MRMRVLIIFVVLVAGLTTVWSLLRRAALTDICTAPSGAHVIGRTVGWSGGSLVYQMGPAHSPEDVRKWLEHRVRKWGVRRARPADPGLGHWNVDLLAHSSQVWVWWADLLDIRWARRRCVLGIEYVGVAALAGPSGRNPTPPRPTAPLKVVVFVVPP